VNSDPDIAGIASRRAHEVARASAALGARIADGAAEPLGRPRPQAEQRVASPPRPGGPMPVGYPVQPDGLPVELAHRLLGAVETALPNLSAGDLTDLARLVRAGDGADGMVAVGLRGDHDAFAVAMQLARHRLPAAGAATAALVRALADTAPVAALLAERIPGDAAAIAAEHGRRWFAVAVVAATLVVRAGDDGRATPGGEAALVVGLAVETTAQVLAERPMPAGWADALAAERRARFLLPQMSSTMLRAVGGRFALLAVGAAAVPEVPGHGLATAVDGGLVVRAGSDDVPISVLVELTAHEPRDSADDDWEQIVELSYGSDGPAELVGMPSTVYPPHDIGFPWRATLRARVHAGGRGSGGAERYRIQLWEAAAAPPVVLRDRPVAPSLPAVVGTALIRTDFSDDDRWAATVTRLTAPDVSGYVADLGVVDDVRFAGAAVEDLLVLATPTWSRSYTCLFVADAVALASLELPVLVVGLRGADRGRTFRVIGDELWGIENNLALSNMDFAEFAAATEDGVFRGF
jgi:hypothetical protein